MPTKCGVCGSRGADPVLEACSPCAEGGYEAEADRDLNQFDVEENTKPLDHDAPVGWGGKGDRW